MNLHRSVPVPRSRLEWAQWDDLKDAYPPKASPFQRDLGIGGIAIGNHQASGAKGGFLGKKGNAKNSDLEDSW